jgi:cyclohexyl-isocyanide hydratase
MIQLYLEYDPQPPFDAGSPGKAGPELAARAKKQSEEFLRQREKQIGEVAAQRKAKVP